MAKPSKLDVVWAENGTSIDPGDTKTELGWVAEIPPYQHLNYITNKHSAALANLNEFGTLEWDTLTSYAKNATAVYNTIVYRSMSDNNIGNIPTVTGWYIDPSYGYDFVVGSDEDLARLASGLVVSSVLILDGTFTLPLDAVLNIGIGVTTKIKGVGQATIVGQVDGPVIQGAPGLYEEDVYFSIQDLAVINLGNGTTNNYTYGFDGCTNLNNVHVILPLGTPTTGEISGFGSCNNLLNCSVVFQELQSGFPATGFSDCRYLVNCSCNIEPGGSVGGGADCDVTGFRNCAHLSNPSAHIDTYGTGYARAFDNCNRIVNGHGQGSCSGSGTGYAYNDCEDIGFCYGLATSTTGTGVAMKNCTGVVYPVLLASTANAQGSTGCQITNTIT